MKKTFPILSLLVVGLFFVGLISSDPFGSRTNVTNDNAINPVVPQTNSVVKFVDSMNAVNDSTGLKARGWKPKRGPLNGPIGTTFFFQGNATVFPAFEGPTTGYVGANFNATTGSNTIDLWLISPVVNAASGDTISFYERSPTGSTFPDSIRVHWASNGDTVPGSGSWVELGKFKTTTTGSWAERRFVLPTAGATGRFAINYRVANGGPSGANSDYIGLDFIRLLGPAGGGCSVPELIYYRFENNASNSSTPNYGTSPVGNNPVTLTGHTIGSGGMYDSALVGNSGATTNLINTGWLTNLGNNSWTIGMFLKNLPMQSSMGTSPCYLFGDVGATAFRCFWAGAGVSATDTAILLRKTGQPDLRLVLPAPYNNRSYYVHFVYNSATSTLSGYRNGVFITSVTWTAPAINGTGFHLAGYNNTASPFFNGAILDEFRVYNRALDAAEITATWNKAELPACLTGVNQSNNEIPLMYHLSQNYPNPFNPVTNIKFSMPNTGLAKLVVFDILGREVATLVNEVKTAGNYVVDFNASSLASGVYFYRLESGNFTDTKKMLLVK